jgi:hypothetical protein
MIQQTVLGTSLPAAAPFGVRAVVTRSFGAFTPTAG